MEQDTRDNNSPTQRYSLQTRRGLFLFCVAISIFIAVGALGGAAAFTSFAGTSVAFASVALPGFLALILSAFFPSMLTKDTKKRRLLLVCSACAAVWAIFSHSSTECCLLSPKAIICLYALAIAALFIPNHESNRTMPACFTHFYSMSTLAALLSVLFAAMAGIVLASGHLSMRLMVTGQGIMLLSLFAAVAAGFGPVAPRLYPILVYLSLVLIWLAVPVAGLEAYLYHGVVDSEAPRFAVTGWKWVYGFCVPALITAVRLLQLGYRYIANAPPTPFTAIGETQSVQK